MPWNRTPFELLEFVIQTYVRYTLKIKPRYGVELLHLSNHHHEHADNDKNGCPPEVASGFVWVNEPMYPMMPVAKQGEVDAYKNNDEADEVCLT